jgi:hypothetical protein
MQNSIWILALQLVVVLGLLFWADRWLHRHLQSVTVLLTNDNDLGLWLYSTVLLPGVILHELSHAAAARILGVKIGKIHLFPQRSKGHIQLGFVPVEETDFVRASLIGGAPFLAGSLAIVALGHWVFGTDDVLNAFAGYAWMQGLRELVDAFRAADAWLWAYLVFAIANTMLPSRSDMHAWPFLAFALVALGGLLILIGGGSLIVDGLGAVLTRAAQWFLLLGASAFLIDLPFFAFIYLIQKALERIKGVRLEYK